MLAHFFLYFKLHLINNLANVYSNDQQADGKEAEKVSQVRKTRGGALLDPDDLIKMVLDDNEFVSVGRCCRYHCSDDV